MISSKLDEEQIIVRSNLNNIREKIKPVVTTKQIGKAQATVKEIYMDEKIEKYILDLILCDPISGKYNLAEIKPLISFGASPRGSINLANAAKCHAFLKHRGYVILEDVREVIYDVLRHRIGLTYEAEAENVTTEDLISQIINEVEVLQVQVSNIITNLITNGYQGAPKKVRKIEIKTDGLAITYSVGSTTAPLKEEV